MEGYGKGGNPDVAFWMRQIRLAQEYRKKCAFEEKWPRWRNYYRGLWNPRVQPSNLFFKMIRTTVPRVYFRNPTVSIKSNRGGFEHQLMAQLLQRTDNMLFEQMGVKKQIKKMVQDNFMFGTAIGKLGFGSQYQSSPETTGTTQAPLVRGKEALEYNILVQPNMPWFLRNPVNAYLIEAGAVDKDSARWDAYIIRRPVDDVQRDPRLRHNKEIGPTEHRSIVRSSDEQMRTPVDMTDLYEIRDRKTGKVFIISPTLTDKVLLFEDDYFFRNGIDVTNALIFNEDDENFWGIPDAQILEPSQLEINDIKTSKMIHRRLGVLKILYKKGAITQEQLDEMIGPDIGAGVEILGNINDVKPMQAGDVPQHLTMGEMEVMQEVRENLGFSRNEFGEFKPGSHSPTATESSNVKAAGEIRVDERRDMIADMLTKTTKDIHPVIFNNFTREQVMDIVGPGGIQLWIAFTPTMLKRGSYTVKVDPDSSVPETKELRTAKALKFYETLKMNPLIDPVALTKYLLMEMHGAEFDTFMPPQMQQGLGLSPEQPMEVGQAATLLPQMQQNLAKMRPQGNA